MIAVNRTDDRISDELDILILIQTNNSYILQEYSTCQLGLLASAKASTHKTISTSKLGS